ncbi:hypothetical protein BBF93_12365 [Hyphomonas sp. CACIAM 19H1]|uniref:efflux RND transporter periplasmic adaptor subunit n=1 Tax=Hyphomonas sp. CACIAM 19H1 TaxID=1873716 RepID=UPI000DF0B5AC|nr:HlyD family efflux transporter periplasmic adaptor subunit [Hyphomonas sp. CACIAM 19H1]AXE66413.1 hypothetical protein BBF93_12365 [Hyphomonas sp. CACIAM 19H1]
MPFRLPQLVFRHYLWAGAAIILALLLVSAFMPRALEVQLSDISRGEINVEVREEGRTRVRDIYLVSAPQAGRLLRIGNPVGETVQAGAVVAVLLPGEAALLDPRSRSEAEAALRASTAAYSAAEAGLAEAEAALDLARREAERAETLFARGISSQAALDRARAELEASQTRRNAAAAGVTRAAAERSGAALRLTPPRNGQRAADVIDIRAPVTGRVLRVMQESEAVIAAGAPILEIGDPASLEIVAEYLSDDAVRIAPGAPVRIEAWGGEAPLEGRVRMVEPFGFRKVSALGIEEQRVNVIIDFSNTDADPQVQRLGHGYRMEVFALVWSGRDEQRVPVAALVRQGSGWAVFREENGKAVLTPVAIGPQDTRYAVVASGLSEGDRVILYPSRDIEPSKSIRARKSQSE